MNIEALLAQAFTAADAAAVLSASGASLGVQIESDGVRIAALLVAKLRFERLLRGSPEAESEFDRDAAQFATDFRAYVLVVAPTAFFPREEALLYSDWKKRKLE